MIIAQALALAVQDLKSAKLPDAANDARILLSFSLGIDRSRLALVLPDEFPAPAQLRFEGAISKRMASQPVSQIIGKRGFYGRDFLVSPDVLDPRPDTELLIDIALEQPFKTVLDLGVGSGCILVSLLAECPTAQGVGIDVSQSALDVARANAQAFLIDQTVTFIQSDWFIDLPAQRFDLIVSNPPYISDLEMKSLDPGVLIWEPEIALSPGGDGLVAYRIITKKAQEFLNKNGRLIVEIGYQQAEQVVDLFKKSGFVQVTVFHDLNAKDRVVSGVFA